MRKMLIIISGISLNRRSLYQGSPVTALTCRFSPATLFAAALLAPSWAPFDALWAAAPPVENVNKHHCAIKGALPG